MIARWCGGLTAACVLSAAAFLAGCSSTTTTGAGSGSTASPVASGTSPACKSADALKASIEGLKNVNIRANGTAAISAQFMKIKQDFNTLKADAKGQFSAQTTAMSSALDKLSSSLDAAKANLNAGTLSALASAAGSVITAGTNLVTAATNAC